MLTDTFSSATEFNSIPQPGESLLAYEHRFGAAPEWLHELPPGRIRSLVRQALKRGAPLSSAELLH